MSIGQKSTKPHWLRRVFLNSIQWMISVDMLVINVERCFQIGLKLKII